MHHATKRLLMLDIAKSTSTDTSTDHNKSLTLRPIHVGTEVGRHKDMFPSTDGRSHVIFHSHCFLAFGWCIRRHPVRPKMFTHLHPLLQMTHRLLHFVPFLLGIGHGLFILPLFSFQGVP